MKTSELTGAALDWAVAKAQEMKTHIGHSGLLYIIHNELPTDYKPSTDWSQGGPIIQRACLNIVPTSVGWEAYPDYGMSNELFETGPTPLIAAMRCFCASNLGDEVEIPAELTSA